MADLYNLQSIKQRYGIVGRSEKLDQALSRALRVSKTELTVLIYGESGVGKEVFSKIIHDQSVRKHNPFIAINCGAIPEGTINSELFGHEKGSFTSATGERKGYFETVNGGTIFLDEIGEMPLDTQAYLLRVLETGEFLRVGSSQVLKTDVRVVAATNVDLKDRMARGKFREDLYYRLNTVPIPIPPLRERKEDILLLFRRFVTDFAEKYRSKPIHLEENAKILLETYPWPGNIRELKNLADQGSVLTDGDFLTAEDLVKIKPELLRRNLPVMTNLSDSDRGYTEREMLFNVIFEMKQEVAELKKFVLELVASNDLKIPSKGEFRSLSEPLTYSNEMRSEDKSGFSRVYKETFEQDEELSSIIIDEVNRRNQEMEDEAEVEETLSLEDNEVQLIRKALEKHKGRRKDAALELGISERTLYRKIKLYDIG